MCVHYWLMIDGPKSNECNRAVIGQNIYSFLTFFTGLLWNQRWEIHCVSLLEVRWTINVINKQIKTLVYFQCLSLSAATSLPKIPQIHTYNCNIVHHLQNQDIILRWHASVQVINRWAAFFPGGHQFTAKLVFTAFVSSGNFGILFSWLNILVLSGSCCLTNECQNGSLTCLALSWIGNSIGCANAECFKSHF